MCSTDSSHCACVIASSSAVRSASSFFDRGRRFTKRSAVSAKVCSVSAIPLRAAAGDEAARDSARLLLGPT